MFMIRATMPARAAQADTYRRVLDAADGRRVVFRTLDIGSDKILPYMKRIDEENPAMGWRALRFGLDRPRLMTMQLQALLRGAEGRPLSVMFPFVTEVSEFFAARDLLLRERDAMAARGRPAPERLEIGAMLETPSLAYAPDAFFRAADFISVGGNDLMQFFYAADRGNERVRKRYDPLGPSWLAFLQEIVARCDAQGAALSFCGEAAGRPLEALGAGGDRVPHVLDAPDRDRPGQADAAQRRSGRGARGGLTGCGGWGKRPRAAGALGEGAGRAGLGAPVSASERLNVGGGGAAVAARLQLEGELLAVIQPGQAGALDLGDVHEDVVAAFIGLDEAVALGGVKPFHGSGRHGPCPSVGRRMRDCRGSRRFKARSTRPRAVSGRHVYSRRSYARSEIRAEVSRCKADAANAAAEKPATYCVLYRVSSRAVRGRNMTDPGARPALRRAATRPRQGRNDPTARIARG
jgi:hypothetical protein